MTPLLAADGPLNLHLSQPGNDGLDFHSREASTQSNRPQLVVTVSNDAYARPTGASPLRVSLVPAYEPCTSPNREHGPPLAHPACARPAQSSQHVTVGTPDANGRPAASVGSGPLRGPAGDPDDARGRGRRGLRGQRDRRARRHDSARPTPVSFRSARHCVRPTAAAGRRRTSRPRPQESRCRSRCPALPRSTSGRRRLLGVHDPRRRAAGRGRGGRARGLGSWARSRCSTAARTVTWTPPATPSSRARASSFPRDTRAGPLLDYAR